MKEKIVVWAGAIAMAVGFVAVVSVLYIGLHAIAYGR